jgi:hypothetical protein
MLNLPVKAVWFHDIWEPFHGKIKPFRDGVPKDLRFDRWQLEYHPQSKKPREWADNSAANDKTDSISDVALPSFIRRRKFNPNGVPVRQIMDGFRSGARDGYSVRSHGHGMTQRRKPKEGPEIFLFSSASVRSAEAIAPRHVREIFEPIELSERADYKAGLKALVMADSTPVLSHRMVYGDRPVSAETPNKMGACQVSGDDIAASAQAYNRIYAALLRIGYGDQRSDEGNFLRKHWPWQRQEKLDEEGLARFDQLESLRRILSIPALRVGAQDAQLLIRLLTLGVVENRAEARRVGKSKYKREKLAPLLTEFVSEPGDADISTFWHNFFADTDEDRRGKSTLAEREKRRADDRKSGLSRRFASVYRINLREFPSEKVTDVLRRLRLRYKYLPIKPSTDVNIFLGKHDSGADLILAAPVDLGLRCTFARPFSYSESGRSAEIYWGDERAPRGRTVPRPSDMKLFGNHNVNGNRKESPYRSEESRMNDARGFSAIMELFRTRVPCCGFVLPTLID